MLKTYSLLSGVTLRVFPDDRFKQNYLSIQLALPATEEDASYNALFPAVLLRGCQSAPDMRHIILRQDDLYGASINTLLRRIGDYQVTGLSCGFISDSYALDGDKILAPMMAFLREILLCPVLEGGVFREDYVQSEKKNLIANIQAQINDKRSYCNSQLMRKMCAKDSYGIPLLGEVEDVQAITPKSLYDHYQKVLRTARIDLFYVGQDPENALPGLLKDIFSQIDRDYVNLPAQTHFCSAGGGTFTETMEIAQAKLAMGFTTPITIDGPEFAAIRVLNVLFGGGMTSKLFMNVREKLSLCYSIGSSYHGSKGILTVYAGIDDDKCDTVREQVQLQLQAICDGDITDRELAAAKEALLSGLRGTHDSPAAIEGYYASAALSGLNMTPAAYMEAVSAVDAAAVSAAAKTLQLDTTYILKGVQ